VGLGSGRGVGDDHFAVAVFVHPAADWGGCR
jgi:hypothetical protein